jgi:hypothetical protein
MVEPLLAISDIQPRGLNADLKLIYDYNFRNADTDYKSERSAPAATSTARSVMIALGVLRLLAATGAARSLLARL